MKKFLAIYIGSMSGENMKKWNDMGEEAKKAKQQEGMNAWMDWGMKNSKSIIDQGSPLGKTKRIDSSGVSDTKNLMTGYVIIEAESHDEAAKKFLNHPHFSVFPGEAVEIMECLPLPNI